VLNSELTAGTRIDHYVVLRLVGRGGMGEVYLARDTQLGRNVALKIIPPEMLGDGISVERFMFEARATARFNHPNIVTIYGVGEHGGRPYVALAYLEGETLRDRMARQRLSLHEALETALAIARALVEAHRHGIVHRDLKPANVFITRADGRVQVLDFGIAKHVENVDIEMLDTVAAGSDGAQSYGAGTPSYMAPEQWRGETFEASDVWALGIILFEMCSGMQPFAREELAPLIADVCAREPAPRLADECAVPARLDELTARCLDKAAERRPRAEEVVAELTELILLDDTLEPFPGLEPLVQQHASVFFGREAELQRALETLAFRGTPCGLAVTGPAGCGKTSLVLAGVVPCLAERGELLLVHVRPGSEPFLALAEAMLHSTRRVISLARRARQGGGDTERSLWMQAVDEVGGAGRLAQRICEDPTRLAFELGHYASELDKDVIFFVDQLEDLCALVNDEDIRTRFVRALEKVVSMPIGRVHVVLALSDEHAHHFASGPLRQLLERAVRLAAPGAELLKRALREPVRVAGYKFSDAQLATEIVASVAGERAALALVQLTARSLWERRDARRKLLERAAYQEMGGMVGVLSEHAGRVLAALRHDELRAVCAMTLRLVAPDGTRALVPTTVLDAGAQRMLHRLVHARLLATSPREGGGTAVELAHRCLTDELPVRLGNALGDPGWWQRERAAPSSQWPAPPPSSQTSVPSRAKSVQLILWGAAGLVAALTAVAVIAASSPASIRLEVGALPAIHPAVEPQESGEPAVRIAPDAAPSASSLNEKSAPRRRASPRPRPTVAAEAEDLYETRQ
jgi:hypothetical protein